MLYGIIKIKNIKNKLQRQVNISNFCRKNPVFCNYINIYKIKQIKKFIVIPKLIDFKILCHVSI